MLDTKQRSNAPEIMDDFSMEGEVLKEALDKIATINRLLGGNKITLQGVKQLIKNKPNNQVITILDAGCGNGDMLRSLAKFARKHNITFNLIGLDANQFSINHAQSLSLGYPNISYYCKDLFNDTAEEETYDIILCTLTLHHFKDDEILSLLEKFKRQARLGIIINDLHRSCLAYYLFKGICYIFGLNDMSRKDGLTSILRGFKKRDLFLYSKQLNLQSYSIRWKWAFRYQWIIKST